MATGFVRRSSKGLTYPFLPGAPGADVTALVETVDRYVLDQWAQNLDATAGLLYGYRGGSITSGAAYAIVNDGTVLLADDATNYVERDGDGVVTANTTAFTGTNTPMAVVVTAGGRIESVQDVRLLPTGPGTPGGGIGGSGTAGEVAVFTDVATIGSIATGTGWLHNDGAGSITYSTPTYADVGAAPTVHTHDASYLTGTTLAATVVMSSLTTVGALASGSIAAGFGAINIGANALTCGGITAGGNVSISDTFGLTINTTGAGNLITLSRTGATTRSLSLNLGGNRFHVYDNTNAVSILSANYLTSTAVVIAGGDVADGAGANAIPGSFRGGRASGTNVAASDTYLSPGQSTGNATPPKLHLQVGLPTDSGTGVQGFIDAVLIGSRVDGTAATMTLRGDLLSYTDAGFDFGAYGMRGVRGLWVRNIYQYGGFGFFRGDADDQRAVMIGRYSATGRAQIAFYNETPTGSGEPASSDILFRCGLTTAGADTFDFYTAGSTGRLVFSLSQGTPAINAVGYIGAFTGTLIEAASGTHARLSLLELAVPTVTGGGAAVTNAQTFYIAGAPSVSGATCNAIWVQSGNVQLSAGDLYVTGVINCGANALTCGTANAPIVQSGSATNLLLKYNTTTAITIDSALVTFASGWPISVANTTNSSSTTTGSGIFAGGVGVAKNLYCSTLHTTAASTSAITLEVPAVAGNASGILFQSTRPASSTVLNTVTLAAGFTGAAGGTSFFVIKVFNDAWASVEALRATNGGRIGIGTPNPNNQCEILSTTTPQVRVAYDTSNYLTVAVSSAGAVTYDATGASAGHTFSDPVTFSALALTAASAAGGAGFRLPHGAAPDSPVNGDMWTTTAGVFARINGATVQLATV